MRIYTLMRKIKLRKTSKVWESVMGKDLISRMCHIWLRIQDQDLIIQYSHCLQLGNQKKYLQIMLLKWVRIIHYQDYPNIKQNLKQNFPVSRSWLKNREILTTLAKSNIQRIFSSKLLGKIALGLVITKISGQIIYGIILCYWPSQ